VQDTVWLRWTEPELGPRASVLFSAASALILAVSGAWVGVGRSGDSQRYIDRGERLLATSPLEYIAGTADVDGFDILFLIPNVVNAVGERVFGGAFPVMSVALNILIYMLVIVVVLETVRRYFSAQALFSPAILCISLPLFFGLPTEALVYLYDSHGSDFLALLVQMVFVIYLGRFVVNASTSDGLMLLVIGCASLFARPSGLVFLVVAVGALIVNQYRPECAAKLVYRASFGALTLSFLIWSSIVWWLKNTRFQSLDWGLRTIVDRFSRGLIVTGRDNLIIAGMESYLDYLTLMVLRFVHYFVPLRMGYSPEHAIFNSFFVLTAIVGLVSLCSRAARLDSRRRVLIAWMFSSIAFLGLLHAATQVEDWRYQLPVWPLLSILVLTGYQLWFEEYRARRIEA